MKRIFTFSFLLIVAVSMVAAAQGAKPDFSGTWKFDLAKSDFGPAQPPEVLTLVVVHKGPAIKVTSTQTSQGATTVNERNITTDGKPNPNKVKTPDGEQEVTSTSKWMGSTLQTSYTIAMQGLPVPTVDTWELNAPKVLTITRKLTHPQAGEIVVKIVYNKQ